MTWLKANIASEAPNVRVEARVSSPANIGVMKPTPKTVSPTVLMVAAVSLRRSFFAALLTGLGSKGWLTP